MVFIKVIDRSKKDGGIDIHPVGLQAADMISESDPAVKFGGSSDDIVRAVYDLPVDAEVLMEAAMAVQKRSIYAS